jgi:hypothetical protein
LFAQVNASKPDPEPEPEKKNVARREPILRNFSVAMMKKRKKSLRIRKKKLL